MPIFKPFKGIRPNDTFIDIFPTASLDNFSLEEIKQKARVKDSYVKMLKPYLVSKSKDVDRNMRKIRTDFDNMVSEKKMIQDDTSYYVYEQIHPNKTVYRGLLGLVSVDDFLEGKIKKHEATIPQRREKLADYLDKVNLQAEPVLLTYNKPSSRVEVFMNIEEKNVPIINFTSENGIRHKIWRIDNRLKMQQLKDALDQIDSFYIADGHHRIGSAALNAKNQKEKDKKHIGNEPYNYVFSYLVAKDSIKIHDYNRLVKNLNGLTSKKFLKKLESSFLIHERGELPYYPSQKFHISMYLDGKFYSLHVKHDLRIDGDDIHDLDHNLLERYIFDDILGIKLESVSENIEYLKGNSTIDGIIAIKEKVDSGEYKAGFAIYPVSFTDLIRISDMSIKMPPKCTLIEPKLMTALVMYDMK
ncbi:MAG: DUF1015 domain-containing protein [Flavobacteriaceae bacterium]|jgi:uncharacterized protein (DUF1015 family)|nr:DUF1015 domain-containing protein [Flavobacteriaceae bacterium]